MHNKIVSPICVLPASNKKKRESEAQAELKAQQEQAEREMEEIKKASEAFEKELEAEREELARLALLLENKSSRSKASLFEDLEEHSGQEESECAAEEAEEDSHDDEAFSFDLPENFDSEESDDF